jgi:hypothetical protein
VFWSLALSVAAETMEARFVSFILSKDQSSLLIPIPTKISDSQKLGLWATFGTLCWAHDHPLYGGIAQHLPPPVAWALKGDSAFLTWTSPAKCWDWDGFGLLGVRHVVHGKACNFILIDEDDKALFNTASVIHLGNGCKASFWTLK